MDAPVPPQPSRVRAPAEQSCQPAIASPASPATSSSSLVVPDDRHQKPTPEQAAVSRTDAMSYGLPPRLLAGASHGSTVATPPDPSPWRPAPLTDLPMLASVEIRVASSNPRWIAGPEVLRVSPVPLLPPSFSLPPFSRSLSLPCFFPYRSMEAAVKDVVSSSSSTDGPPVHEPTIEARWKRDPRTPSLHGTSSAHSFVALPPRIHLHLLKIGPDAAMALPDLDPLRQRHRDRSPPRSRVPKAFGV